MDVALCRRHELSLSMSKPYSVSRTREKSLIPKHCGLLTDKVTFTWAVLKNGIWHFKIKVVLIIFDIIFV